MNEVIHLAANAEFSAYTYTQVYAQASATPTINGTAVTMPAGISIMVIVKSISATADVFVIGKPKLISPQYLNG